MTDMFQSPRGAQDIVPPAGGPVQAKGGEAVAAFVYSLVEKAEAVPEPPPTGVEFRNHYEVPPGTPGMGVCSEDVFPRFFLLTGVSGIAILAPGRHVGR